MYSVVVWVRDRLHVDSPDIDLFLNSASLPLYTACRPQFNLRLKDTSGPNNSLLKLIKNG